MAHQTTIVENGMTYNVTEFDHTAQEIDDAVSNLGGASTPQGAIAALGAGVRLNLLINPFFRVDQRNRGTYNSGGWTLDGWYNGAGSDGTITQNSNGAVFSIERTGIAFYQPIDPQEHQLSGRKVTFSVLYSGGAPRLTISRFDGAWHHYTSVNFPASENMALATVSAELGDFQSTDQIRAVIYATANNTTFQVYCAKFEVGENQTIAYQDGNQLTILERPDPIESLKCERYQYVVSPLSFSNYKSNYAYLGTGIYIATNQARIFIPIHVLPRIRPTLTYNGTLIVSNGKATYNVSNITLEHISRSGISVLVNTGTGAAVGDPAMLRIDNDGTAQIIFDANLS